MSRKKNQVANIDDRSRYFKLLMYPDNPKHKLLIDNLLGGYYIFDDSTVWDYIGIKHQTFDGDDTKPHYHFYLMFKYAMRTVALCRRFDFFTDSGLPDDQFVRVITGDFDNALVYLTHLNTPDKEQYNESDLLGSFDMKQLYHKAALKYTTKHFDKRDAFYQVQKWISAQPGIISAHQMLSFLLKHECFAIRNEPWLKTLWSEHNSRLAYFARKEVTDAI